MEYRSKVGFSSRMRRRFIAWQVLVFVLLFTPLVITIWWWEGFKLVPVAAFIATLLVLIAAMIWLEALKRGTVSVVAHRGGLEVSFGPFPRRTWVFNRDRITQVGSRTSQQVDLRRGGYQVTGYNTRAILGEGQLVFLQMTDGFTWTIAVDDAQETLRALDMQAQPV